MDVDDQRKLSVWYNDALGLYRLTVKQHSVIEYVSLKLVG